MNNQGGEQISGNYQCGTEKRKKIENLKNPSLSFSDLPYFFLWRVYFIYFLSDLYYVLPSPDFGFCVFLIVLGVILCCIFEIFFPCFLM